MELKVLRVQLVPADSEPAANSILMASASTEAQNAAALAVGRAGRVTWNGTIWNQVWTPSYELSFLLQVLRMLTSLQNTAGIKASSGK